MTTVISNTTSKKKIKHTCLPPPYHAVRGVEDVYVVYMLMHEDIRE